MSDHIVHLSLRAHAHIQLVLAVALKDVLTAFAPLNNFYRFLTPEHPQANPSIHSKDLAGGMGKRHGLPMRRGWVTGAGSGGNASLGSRAGNESNRGNASAAARAETGARFEKSGPADAWALRQRAALPALAKRPSEQRQRPPCQKCNKHSSQTPLAICMIAGERNLPASKNKNPERFRTRLNSDFQGMRRGVDVVRKVLPHIQPLLRLMRASQLSVEQKQTYKKCGLPDCDPIAFGSTFCNSRSHQA